MLSLQVSALNMADIDCLLPVEEQAHSHPWTRGHFTDSFVAAYAAFGIRNADGDIQAYMFLMPVLEELHLLNITVQPASQGRGLARVLLDFMQQYGREQGFESVLLEVRRSNARAIAVYQSAGFAEIGKRKNYYPVDAHTREDAIVMRKIL